MNYMGVISTTEQTCFLHAADIYKVPADYMWDWPNSSAELTNWYLLLFQGHLRCENGQASGQKITHATKVNRHDTNGSNLTKV